MTRKKKKAKAKKKPIKRSSLKNRVTKKRRPSPVPKAKTTPSAGAARRKKPTVSSYKKAARSLLENELGRLSVQKFNARLKRDKKKLGIKEREVKAQIRRLK